MRVTVSSDELAFVSFVPWMPRMLPPESFANTVPSLGSDAVLWSCSLALWLARETKRPLMGNSAFLLVTIPWLFLSLPLGRRWTACLAETGLLHACRALLCTCCCSRVLLFPGPMPLACSLLKRIGRRR